MLHSGDRRDHLLDLFVTRDDNDIVMISVPVTVGFKRRYKALSVHQCRTMAGEVRFAMNERLYDMKGQWPDPDCVDE